MESGRAVAGTRQAHADHGHRQRHARILFPMADSFSTATRRSNMRSDYWRKAPTFSILAANPRGRERALIRAPQSADAKSSQRTKSDGATASAVSGRRRTQARSAGDYRVEEETSGPPFSPSTPTKPAVARAAVGAGAEIVNDVSGFRWDPQMTKTVAELKCGAVLMHMRGRPEEWRTLPPPGDVVLLVKRELKDWAEKAVLAGVRRERIVLDPGFGFREKLRRELSADGSLQRIAVRWISAAGGHFAKIVHRANSAQRWAGCSSRAASLWHACGADGADSERRAHLADARREGRGRSGASRRRDPRGAIEQAFSLPGQTYSRLFLPSTKSVHRPKV